MIITAHASSVESQNTRPRSDHGAGDWNTAHGAVHAAVVRGVSAKPPASSVSRSRAVCVSGPAGYAIFTFGSAGAGAGRAIGTAALSEPPTGTARGTARGGAAGDGGRGGGKAPASRRPPNISSTAFASSPTLVYRRAGSFSSALPITPRYAAGRWLRSGVSVRCLMSTS